MNNFKSQRCPITNSLSPNTISVAVGYHISYKASSADYGCPTTAIVIDDHIFLVLNGDHKAQLGDVNNINTCLDYFIDNIDKANEISEHHIIVGNQIDMFGIRKSALRLIGENYVEKIEAKYLKNNHLNLKH